MCTDRELLELAAKANGYVVKGWCNGYLVFFNPATCSAEETWNPLTDDGQALRLAFACGISWGVARHSGRPLVIWWVGGSMCSAEMPPKCAIVYEDPLEWTRRAIVRAAAEIGAAM